MAREEPVFTMYHDSRRGRGRGMRGKSRRKHPQSTKVQGRSTKEDPSIDIQSAKDSNGEKPKSYSRRKISDNWSRYDEEDIQDDEVTQEERLKHEEERFQLMLKASRVKMSSSQFQITNVQEHRSSDSSSDFFNLSYSSLSDSIQELPIHVRLCMDRSLLVLAGLCEAEEDTMEAVLQSSDLQSGRNEEEKPVDRGGHDSIPAGLLFPSVRDTHERQQLVQRQKEIEGLAVRVKDSVDLSGGKKTESLVDRKITTPQATTSTDSRKIDSIPKLASSPVPALSNDRKHHFNTAKHEDMSASNVLISPSPQPDRSEPKGTASEGGGVGSLKSIPSVTDNEGKEVKEEDLDAMLDELLLM